MFKSYIIVNKSDEDLFDIPAHATTRSRFITDDCYDTHWEWTSGSLRKRDSGVSTANWFTSRFYKSVDAVVEEMKRRKNAWSYNDYTNCFPVIVTGLVRYALVDLAVRHVCFVHLNYRGIWGGQPFVKDIDYKK
jgi:hypothetical protein